MDKATVLVTTILLYCITILLAVVVTKSGLPLLAFFFLDQILIVIPSLLKKEID